MLRIRSLQDAVFRKIAREKFDENILGSVQDAWPIACERFGSDRLQAVVKAAVDAALARGFETEYDVGRFVHLAFAFESIDFLDQKWAEAVMSKVELSPRVRMNQLFDAAQKYLENTGKL